MNIDDQNLKDDDDGKISTQINGSLGIEFVQWNALEISQDGSFADSNIGNISLIFFGGYKMVYGK